MVFMSRYSSLPRQKLPVTEYRFHGSLKENGLQNSSKNLSAIQRSDELLWPLLLSRLTRSPCHRVSIP
jgi:hypothetical protein